MSEALPKTAPFKLVETATPAPSSKWPKPAITSTLVSKPVLGPNALAYVQEVLISGWWGYGPVAKSLQAEVERLYQGEQHVLATSSCTAAMHLALRASDVGPGDEVIVPAFTYVSTAIVATYCGATPVFADIDPRTLTITKETVEPLLTERTKVIMPMHYAGPPADFAPIRRLAAERGIVVVEDAAHALGSLRDGRPVGIDADFAAFSFAPTKQIASSNGGILLFKDPTLRAKIDQLAFLGLAVDTYGRTVATGVSPTQEVVRLGNKYKIDDLAAAIAYDAFERLEAIVACRGKIADRYYAGLAECADVELMPRPANCRISWYIMPIRVPAESRDHLRAYLATHAVGNTVHYPNLADQAAFRPFGGRVPVTAQESARVISLPMHEAVSMDEADRICSLVRDFFRCH